MLYLNFIVAILASAITAQLSLPNTPDGVLSIATAPPSPGDIGLPLASDASSRMASISSEIAGHMSSVTSSLAAQASSLKSEASGNVMSITSSLAAEASSIASKASSISSEIASKTSALNIGSEPTSTATGNAASHPTGAMAFGALFGAGVIVVNL
ncbi:BgTH12-07735 [Blumeria graminis f. sp. triticale]|uniref:Bgt-20668 n=2 Tax=Blumeria graminis TaxID=34373 RepID=A0A9X9MPR0_BLUGR|nr:BgTH12-07735 [Blumeria graminis f. sp. triticale]VDB96358.1 Bgt-20668 [Blumeria graminis f. sp. tritici]